MKEVIEWKFQGGENFGFVIPDDREYYGGDFYVTKSNFNGAVTGNRVKAHQVVNSKGKKPEAKIVEVISKRKKVEKQEFVEGIYSGGDGNFWFIDVPGQEKGYFVYGLKKNGARDGDKVRAELVDFKGKKEAIVVDILEKELELVEWTYQDANRFGFVIQDDKKEDIFIAGSRKNNAKDGDRVTCEIIKRGWKNPEGVIREIL